MNILSTYFNFYHKRKSKSQPVENLRPSANQFLDCIVLVIIGTGTTIVGTAYELKT